jgi:membrane-anchored glycerophosphoryl diester phosphodiesterase (GDPDase)
MIWFATRTMFILPLIADQRFGFIQALRESWRETRVRFWELLIINLIAGLIGMLGMYVMYIGLIFSMPICLTIVSSAYEERFGAGKPIAD